MNKALPILLMLLVTLASCKRQGINIFRPGDKEIEKFLVQEIDFEYFSSKAKVNYEEEGNKLSFTANIRMKKDSVIWLSATAPLGIEAVRAMITRDSVFIMNRLQNTYAAYSTDYFTKNYNIDLTLTNLQNIILGNLLIPKSRGDRLVKSKDPVCMILEQNHSPINVQNFVAAEIMKITGVIVEEQQSGAKLIVNYEDFKPLEGALFASKSIIKAEIPAKEGQKKDVEISINHNKIELGKPLPFPFNVPGKYETQTR